MTKDKLTKFNTDYLNKKTNSFLLVSIENIISNYRFLKKKANNTEIGVSIKADAYGLGFQKIFSTLLKEGCKTFFVATSVPVSLESPGGGLSDTLGNIIYSYFPIFQWFSQPCNGCKTFIRVSQFNPSIHSSSEEAIEDQRVLPFDQSEEWYLIDNVNSFQYPPSDAYPLEQGIVYCWQIMMEKPTTVGTEQMMSSIYSFKINQSDGSNLNNSNLTSSILLALQQTLGDDQFNALFGSQNELQDYIPTGQIEINGISVDESSLNYLLNQINNDTYQIQSILIE